MFVHPDAAVTGAILVVQPIQHLVGDPTHYYNVIIVIE
jgi:hypothetical protein